MLRKIPTKTIYTDFDENVYFEKCSSRTLFLVHSDEKDVCFFNPNNFDTLQCTPTEFEQMTSEGELFHCQYVLVYAYIPYEETKTTVFVTASNDQDTLYNKLSEKLNIVAKGYNIFNACYIQNTKTGQIVLIKNNLSDLQNAIQQYELKKKFRSSPVDTKKAISTAIQQQEDKTENTSKSRNR